MFRSIAVFCGSKSGADPLFAEHASLLGKLIAQNNITLIYGGGNCGLMGITADAVLENGGTAIGVMPEVLVKREVKHDNLTQLHIVEGMHERKKMMYDLCDAAVILPGGYGTMDELFEMITWNNLSIHDKKIIVLNSAGFYDLLIEQIFMMQQKGFLYGDPANSFSIVHSPEAVLEIH